MILSLAVILQTHAFLALRFQTKRSCDERALVSARAEAGYLARGRERDEPGALFFALARRPRAVPGLWDRFVQVLTEAQARSIGVRILFDHEDMRRLRIQAAVGHANYPDVHDWMKPRLHPLP